MDLITGDIFTLKPPKQSLKAWEPFWDCVDILFQFQNSDIADCEEELPEWRIAWVAGISLLRTIGHVLAKVDADLSSDNRREVERFWQRMQANRNDYQIFWNFIEIERNNILKTYQFGAKFTIKNGIPQILIDDKEDAFQKYRIAVYWWRKELMTMESKLKA